MGMTMTQKILAAHAGLDYVEPGQLIEAKLDLVLGNDVTTPPAIEVFPEGAPAPRLDSRPPREQERDGEARGLLVGDALLERLPDGTLRGSKRPV